MPPTTTCSPSARNSIFWPSLPSGAIRLTTIFLNASSGLQGNAIRESRRLADAGEHVSRIFVARAHKLFAGMCRRLVEDVDVERRHGAGQTAGVLRVGPGLRPHVDLLGGDVLQLLPA